MAQVRDDASLGDLFSRLAEETSSLVRQEVRLAKAELRESAQEAGRSIASLLIGGAVAYAGFLAILAAIIVGLGQLGLPWWLSALIVGIVVVAIGYVLISRARSGLQASNLMPDRTIESLKEDREWVKEQIA